VVSRSTRPRARTVSRTGPWAFPKASGIPSGPHLQSDPPHPSLPYGGKHIRMIFLLKREKHPALLSSYRSISLLNTIGELFEKILLARILHEVSMRGLMRDERFGFRPRYSTYLELSRLVERITRHFGVKEANRRSLPRPDQSLRYRLDRWPPLQANTPKLPVLHSPNKLLLPPWSDVQSVLPDGHVISSRHAGLSLYVNEMPTSSYHVELALYANETAIIATWIHISMTFNGGWVNGESPLTLKY